jgi:hypothetical protein
MATEEETRVPYDSSGRITVNLGELSSKKRSAVIGMVKDMGFTPREIKEVVILLPGSDDEHVDKTNSL